MNRQGFTIIELMVVIAIIGILASLVLIALGGARDRAKDARIKSDVSQLRKLAETIGSDNLDGSFAGVGTCFKTAIATLNSTTPPPECKGLGKSVATLRSDILAQGGSLTIANLANSDTTRYCVQAKLKTGNNFCMDSKGLVKNDSNLGKCDATYFDCFLQALPPP